MKIVIKQLELQRLMAEFASRTIQQSFQTHPMHQQSDAPEPKVTFSGDPQDGSLVVTLEADPPRK